MDTRTSQAEPATAEIDRDFTQTVLRYFLSFLQTDFKKQQAPRRRIQLKSEVGFRTGLPLRKYVTLYQAAWRFISEAPEKGLTFKVSPGQYRAPVSATLRDLISQQVSRIEAETVERIGTSTIGFAAERRGKALADPEKYVEAVQMHFVEEVGARLVQPLLAMLEGHFREAAYSAIESIYDVETDLTNVVSAGVLGQLPSAVNTLIVSGETAAMQAVFDEFLARDDLSARIKAFFDDFATADAFHELRDLQHALRSAENQSLYLYLCDLRFGQNAFPLFFIPATLEYVEDERAFVLEFDPHLFINKQAIDWVLQERAGESARLPISPVEDRILYLDGRKSFLDEMAPMFSRLVPAFDLAAEIDLSKLAMQQASSPTLKLSTAAYFAIFDKSDESLVNDYEELLAAFSEEQQGASRLFDNIIRGFLFDDPVSVNAHVDADWEAMDIPSRLVATTPIPVNEEQRKILAALKKPGCNYVSVQGPPGTGKTHSITVLAFEGIINGETVLILSDKNEALDVVQDKLESALSKVRHGDEEFPNPILRLGRSGSTYGRLVKASAREKIKRHLQAARQVAPQLEREAEQKQKTLREDIGKTVDLLSGIRLEALDELHRLEAELEKTRPLLLERLREPRKPELITKLNDFSDSVDTADWNAVLERVMAEPDGHKPAGIVARLTAWRCASEIAEKIGSREALSMFSELGAEHHQPLLKFIAEYESLRMPVFGWLFRGAKVQALNLRVGAELPCPDPIDLHKRLGQMKQVARALGQIRESLSAKNLEMFTGFAYRLLREGEATRAGVSRLAGYMLVFCYQVAIGAEELESVLDVKGLDGPATLLDLVLKGGKFAALWADVAGRMAALPQSDYVGTKTQLEQLNTARMTTVIDTRFMDFVENKKATMTSIGGVIKGKQKFPEDEFEHLADAFPVIIAGIREYAEYVPLKQKIFDLVIIDEASQVSVAQALPALLRAKRVVVFGDQNQFSNVKSANASNAINASHLTELEAVFREKVSRATTKIDRLKHFDVKRSILEFFDLISNYQTMLRKHFRGYQELISFSSKHFYFGQLQAIKIRSRPIEEVVRFEVLEGVGEDEGKRNVNRAEAEFIRDELRRMLDEGETMSVGVITPFREQVKVLNDVLYRDARGQEFESQLHLKIMSFDSCQGEERDLIIYSMVATEARDALNYIFPVDLNNVADRVGDTLKVQRLNVGFSRGKEAFLFVLSKPVDQFRGAIGRVLQHYKSILETRVRPEEDDVDPASPMEKRVLDWIGKTQFVQANDESVELIAQFPIGEYLKQLDPHYSHPAYRCDFLLRFHGEDGPVNIIIEYDGFAEHFVERQRIHNGNWEHYYRPEDVERQMVIESYNYKFLRLNRFNLGTDPVETLSRRLYELCDLAGKADDDSELVAKIKEDAGALEDGSKKRCSKCGEIRAIESFFDPNLKQGNGGYGRVCIVCKGPGAFRKRRARRRPGTANKASVDVLKRILG